MSEPLTRASITVASRVMLVVYPLFFAGIAAALLLTAEPRLRATPAWDYAARVADLDMWGAGFALVAAALTAALAASSRALYRAALAVACVWMIIFSVVTLLAAVDTRASYGAWTWSAFVAAACWASLRSIAAGER